MNDGWIKIYRDIWKNPVVCKDPEHFTLWVYLLTNVCWNETDVMFKGKRITLKPGEMTTGRKRLAQKLGISESKVQRILKEFEIEHQIEQRTDHQCRLISIVSWEKYQGNEQRNEQRVNNERTTSEQRVNTNKEYKNIRNKEYYHMPKNNNEKFELKGDDEIEFYTYEELKEMSLYDKR